jgi:crotonobetainyl-CoA:carnitine CoA-transferase CaiB-like acyl-CoA transferase
MCLDLGTTAGRELAGRLCDSADVLIENMRPGVMDRLGLGYEELSARNARLVYASATGAGREGPRASRPSLDIVGQAFSGVVAHTGTPETGPLPVGSAIADHGGAVWLAYGVMTALYARERTGRGQRVETSLLGSMMGLQQWELSHFFLTGVDSGQGGRGHPLAKGAWRVFRAADGYFAMAGITEPRWEPLCTALGCTDLMSDERFATPLARLEFTDSLNAVLEQEFSRYSLEELLPMLDAADQVVAAVMDYAALADDEQVQSNGYVAEVHAPTGEPLRMVGVPVRLSETPGSIRTLPAELGAHTVEVLGELGLKDSEIAALFASGVAGTAV